MPYHAIPCNIMHYHDIPCNTMQYHAIPCNTMQNHAIPCNTMQYNAIPCNTMQYINNCLRSVPLPCGQYNGNFLSIPNPSTHILLSWELNEILLFLRQPNPPIFWIYCPGFTLYQWKLRLSWVFKTGTATSFSDHLLVLYLGEASPDLSCANPNAQVKEDNISSSGFCGCFVFC